MSGEQHRLCELSAATTEASCRAARTECSLPHDPTESGITSGITSTSNDSCEVHLPSTSSSRIQNQQLVGGQLNSGWWRRLPDEVVEDILWRCSSVQLAMLKSSCRHFNKLPTIECIARSNLRAIPRAKSLKPNVRDGESYLSLLHFVNQQSAAAAQATAVSCGGHHTSALLQVWPSSLQPTASASASSTSTGPNRQHQPHALYTFGRNFHGQLGTGDFEDHASPRVVSLGFQPCPALPGMEEETTPAVVNCGSHYSMCMSRRGELFSWGLGRSGELGQGPQALLEVPSPTLCRLCQVRIISVSCGASHTLAIGESGNLWSCGSNFCGQLGNGTLQDSLQLQLVQNMAGTRIVLAAAGAAHSVALASDGSLFTWGNGTRGQLGHSQLQSVAMPGTHNSIVLLLPQKISRLDPSQLSPVDRVTAMSARGFHTMVLTVGGSILAFGANSSGQLGLGDTADRWKPTKVNLALPGEDGRSIKAVQVACGANHTVALVSNVGRTSTRATGANSWGQLGTGDVVPRLRFSPTLPVPRVIAVQAGDEHCAAVTEDGSLFLWGRGDSGQLGLGDAQLRTQPTLLASFTVVHPDHTLRKSKRSTPLLRPAASGSPASEGQDRLQDPCASFL